MLTSLLCAWMSLGSPNGLALIVTNNRSSAAERPDLQYADDDGAQYADVFADLLGAERVTLLTSFDPASRPLHGAWVERASEPTLANLRAAVATIGRRAAELDAADVYLVFAGHGDVANGEGYLDLADGRLTAAALDEEVVTPIASTRVHLIIDSCNSYFMLNPRRPGGRRQKAELDVRGLLERHPNVGALLSTSAEAVTYEWSEIQSGIFSYEVRSGLRGGADANNDGQVSYDELGAFVAVANAAVVNELYRPRVFMRAPATDAAGVFARLSSDSRAVILPAEQQVRITLRDERGVRLLDAHKEAGTTLTLHLPASGAVTLTSWDAREAHAPRRHHLAAAPGRFAIDELPAPVAVVAGRGEAPVFGRLFAEPFGVRALAAAQPSADVAAPFGVTRRDVDHLQRHLELVGQLDRQTRGASVITGALVLGALAAPLIVVAQNYDLTTGEKFYVWGLPAGVAGGLVLGTALSELQLASYPFEDDLRAAASLPEDERAVAVWRVREAFRAEAEREARMRKILGGVGLVGGTAALGLGTALAVARRDHDAEVSPVAYVGIAEGAVLALMGAYWLTLGKMPVERSYAIYSAGENPLLEPASRTLSVTPIVAPTTAGVTLGLAARF